MLDVSNERLPADLKARANEEVRQDGGIIHTQLVSVDEGCRAGKEK